MDKNASLYQDLLTIRQFESQLIEKFSTGVFPGTTHTCLGQEANAVGVIQHLHDEDIVVSNHRGHGHFLAYGGDPKALFAELMGKTSGVSGGLGGSQHLHWRNFYSSGIQGGTLAMATGMALAENHKGSPAIVVDFMGDGTLGEGIVYECLNMISLWQLPILIVLENNHIAQTTPSDLVIAGDVAKRFEAFDLVTSHIDSSDVLKILPLAGELISQVRVARSPRVLIIDTARLGTHSKGDDTRSPEHLEELWRTRDPVAIQGKRLGEAERIVIESLVSQRIDTAYLAATGEE